ncbi:MAG: YqgE/AlgH family protein [Planctomycetes bacterium]|nr:YqgE/AlgH family protein [Planctomycetota bacterium]
MDLNTFHNDLTPGLLLIAKPEMMDPRFIMSVSVVCLHDEEGSMALTLNRPAPMYVDPVTFSLHQEVELGRFPVYLGGPVQMDSLFYLFQSHKEIEDSTEVMPGLYLSSSPAALKILQNNDALDQSKVRFFLGYGGWSYYQLECEISNGSWFTHPGSVEDVFYSPPEDLWLHSLKGIGPDFYHMGRHFLEKLE